MGNTKSQKKIFDHYYNYVMSIAMRYAKNLQEAEEIGNDSFIKMFNNLKKHDSNKPFDLWLRRITINCAIDQYRKNNKQSNIVSLYHPVKLAYNTAALEMDASYLTACINSLPPSYRLTFNLSIIDGYSHQEIADELEVSVGTVKSNLHKARKKLQVMISKQETISSVNRSKT